MDASESRDWDAAIRRALRTAIRRSRKSRNQIVEELCAVHGFNVSVPILNNWTGDSKRERRVPAVMVPALCDVLGDDSLQRALLSEDQLGKLQLGECIAKWLDKKAVTSKLGSDGGKVRRKVGRRAAAAASRP